jgi:hypothetical protein
MVVHLRYFAGWTGQPLPGPQGGFWADVISKSQIGMMGVDTTALSSAVGSDILIISVNRLLSYSKH